MGMTVSERTLAEDRTFIAGSDLMSSTSGGVKPDREPDLDLHQPTEQPPEHGGVMVDPFQQHGLAQQRDAAARQPLTGLDRRRRQFVRMIDVEHQPHRPRTGQGRQPRVGQPLRRHQRHAGMNPDHLDMVDRRQRRGQFGQPVRRQQQRITAALATEQARALLDGLPMPATPANVWKHLREKSHARV
mgnify:CR=1 FL=1